MGYMEFKGLMPDKAGRCTRTRQLPDLARIETASVNGNLVDIAKELGPMVQTDFYVSIAGSAAGTHPPAICMVGGLVVL